MSPEVCFILIIKESLERCLHRKNLITLCFATVFTLGLAACGSSGGNKDTAMDEHTAPWREPTVGPAPRADGAMEPTADEQLAELKEEIATLRTQLGIEDDDDLGGSVTVLQDRGRQPEAADPGCGGCQGGCQRRGGADGRWPPPARPCRRRWGTQPLAQIASVVLTPAGLVVKTDGCQRLTPEGANAGPGAGGWRFRRNVG